ncbi:phage head closure protein [Notoacmeibacter sp. MSK16QG-6]|uniref:phage head closure protein n=1 Tax=Notoacmeibacter sp. MSK16QG-6 TaxID=2957982 RepID=UPI0020A1AAB6|nr:phage head closure protein [Notoacmeibacter sp. MSK16QG-6]MCP1198133.1 phage head closure protein [Notoacmeibacter sp. MSK16QG-6]
MTVEFMDAGKLRTRLVLEAPVRTPDGAGGHEVEWQTVGEFFAHVEPTGVSATVAGGAVRQELTHRVTLRQRSDIAPAMRLLRNGHAMRIETVSDLDGTGRYLVCGCTELEGWT